MTIIAVGRGLKRDVGLKWIKALRSGKYKQARNTLKTDEGYCCLGVLAEVIGLKLRKDDNGFYYAYEGDRRRSSGAHLDEEIYADLGLKIDAPRKLATLNDGLRLEGDEEVKPHSFKEIADYIEQNLLEAA